MATKNVREKKRIFRQKNSSSKTMFLSFRYQIGMLKTDFNFDQSQNSSDQEMNRLINETTSSILRIYDEFGPQAVEDWEVNELLEWTHGLNFDDYLVDWRTVGTSASSNVIYGELCEKNIFDVSGF